MKKNKKRIADGIIFIALGLNTLWLWICCRFFTFHSLGLRQITVSSELEQEGISILVQNTLFFTVSLFFIVWGIWTLSNKKADADNPAMKSGLKWVVIFVALPVLVVGSYLLGRNETSKKTQAYLEKLSKKSIPTNLEQCFEQIDLMLSDQEIEQIKAGTEDDMSRYHFKLGMWIRNEFALWRGPLIGSWFRERGVDHPDNMSGIILEAYWRHLNNVPIDVDDLIRKSHEYYKEDDPELYAEKMKMLETAGNPE